MKKLSFIAKIAKILHFWFKLFVDTYGQSLERLISSKADELIIKE
jgi:hypothetical protein